QGEAVSDGSREDVLTAIAENIDGLAGNHWAMVVLSPEAVDCGAHEVLPRDRTLIRLLGRSADIQFHRSLHKLSSQGYRLAVPAPENGSPVSECAQIVYVNLKQCDPTRLAATVDRIREGSAKAM